MELYDLTADPLETRSVSGAVGPRKAYQKLLQDWLSTGAGQSEETILSPEARKHLQELGYID